MSHDRHRPPQRTALAGLRGGTIEKRGDSELSRRLAFAMDVVGGDVPTELTHGFHTYPARFHPLLVRRLIVDARLPPPARVLDPFVGSGTTLIEAALAGAAGIGVDINPLAVELSRLKATPWTEERRTQLTAAAREVVESLVEQVRASRKRAFRSARPDDETRFDDPRFYLPHVFRELVSLRLAIDEATEGDDVLRMTLLLGLSSIVTKVSLQRSDTDETIVERSIPRGAATRHFARRIDELAERMGVFASRVPRSTPPPDVREGDARQLAHVAKDSIDIVITSPPYVGTYDYMKHHVRRFGWLGLDPTAMRGGEIGGRRGGSDPAAALAQWGRDVRDFASEIARVLKPGAHAFLLVGDSVIGGRAVSGPGELERAAGVSGLQVVAAASQDRFDTPAAPGARSPAAAPAAPAAPRGPRKREHLMMLRKA